MGIQGLVHAVRAIRAFNWTTHRVPCLLGMATAEHVLGIELKRAGPAVKMIAHVPLPSD